MGDRLLVLDVDGTLLDSQHVLRPRVAAVIRRAGTSGFRIILATGKLLSSVRPLLDEMSISGPQIVLNGAATCDSVSGMPLRFAPLDPDAREATIALVRHFDPTVLVSCFGLDAIFMDEPHPRSGIFVEYGEGPQPPVLVSNLSAADLPPVAKVLLHSSHPQLRALRAFMQDRLPDSVMMTSTTPDFLEFFAAQAGKGLALADLRSRLGVEKEDVVAIGDGENDIPLFGEAGLAIAMASASSETKAAADRIAPSSDEDGVAVVVEELLPVR